jgi:hypothetical protein
VGGKWGSSLQHLKCYKNRWTEKTGDDQSAKSSGSAAPGKLSLLLSHFFFLQM